MSSLIGTNAGPAMGVSKDASKSIQVANNTGSGEAVVNDSNIGYAAVAANADGDRSDNGVQEVDEYTTAYINLDEIGMATVSVAELARLIERSNDNVPKGIYFGRRGFLTVYYASNERREEAIKNKIKIGHVIAQPERPRWEARRRQGNNGIGGGAPQNQMGEKTMRLVCKGVPAMDPAELFEKAVADAGFQMRGPPHRLFYRDTKIEDGRTACRIVVPDQVVPGVIPYTSRRGNRYLLQVWYYGIRGQWCQRCGETGHFRRDCKNEEFKERERKEKKKEAEVKMLEVIAKTATEKQLTDSWAEDTEEALTAKAGFDEMIKSLKIRETRGHQNPFSNIKNDFEPNPEECDKMLREEYTEWGLFAHEKILPFFNGRHFLSNFFKCEFTYDGVLYNSVEQGYYHLMCKKAGYAEGEFMVLQATHAAEVKHFAKNLNISKKCADSVTEDDRKLIIEKCVMEKFYQNKLLRNFLFATDGHELVEASPADSFFGIGMGMYDEKFFDRKKWGKNILGEILEKTRAEMQRCFPGEWQEWEKFSNEGEESNDIRVAAIDGENNNDEEEASTGMEEELLDDQPKQNSHTEAPQPSTDHADDDFHSVSPVPEASEQSITPVADHERKRLRSDSPQSKISPAKKKEKGVALNFDRDSHRRASVTERFREWKERSASRDRRGSIGKRTQGRDTFDKG